MRKRALTRRCYRRGQGLVEYALIIAGVALIAAVGIAIFGHKVADMIGMTATVLPGAHADDNAPIVSGKLIETTSGADGNIALDANGVAGHNGTGRLSGNLWGDESIGETLVAEPTSGNTP
jgi:pilus assembly protein Flp/PilA